MSDFAPYTVPQEPGRWRALTLALVVHAALIGLLWFGVRWQSETPTAVEAEVWDMKTQQAAPKPVPEPPPPEQAAAPVKPVVKAPPPPPPVERPVEKPVERPDIALAQEKKRKELERKAEEERRKAEATRLAALKEAEEKEKRLRLARAEAEEQAKKKQRAAELAQREEQRKTEAAAQKQAAEKAERLAAEKAQKLAADKKKAEQKRAQELAEQQQRDKARADEMRRIAAATGSGGSGEAARSSSPSRGDPSYVAKVAAKIKSNTIFNVPGDLEGNPPVEYIVDLLPDGSVRNVRKLKSSGVPGFDEAVQRAIHKSVPFPPDKSGAVPSNFSVSYKPKDLA